jgi:hypothetical protein
MEYEQATNKAREYVDSLVPDLVNDLGGLAYIRRALHTGADAFGNRLTFENRRVLIATKIALSKKIKEKWVEEGKPGPEGPEQYYRLYDKDIRTELVSRYLSDTSNT